MKALALALTAALALALGACSSDKNPSSSSSGGTSASTTSGIKQDAHDATLTTKVKSALAADVGLKTLTGISVTSDGSVVTLKGAVDTAANKSRAEQVARGVDGVSSVKNELTVKSGG
ncbi:MAG TPA: BON domain-containing protein [Burkholderiales bacterium]|jgi:osmotically-inducible protein OsmY